jgi:hypothetical protein
MRDAKHSKSVRGFAKPEGAEAFANRFGGELFALSPKGSGRPGRLLGRRQISVQL